MLSGIVGVPMGSILSTKLKQKYPRADPLICAAGLILSAGLLGAGIYTANWNIYFAFLMLFIGEVALNLNWSIVADILLVSADSFVLFMIFLRIFPASQNKRYL